LSEQERVASELDQRVAERTRELAETNAELQLQVGLLQHLPVSAWTLKPDGTPDFVNRVWLEYSGQTLDFVRSHPEAWMAAVHPEDRETASKAFWEGVHSGQRFVFETRSLRARDETYRWHLNQAVVLRDGEGKVLRFVGTTTDIDDQKRAEEELRARENNLRQIVDSIPGLVCTLGPSGQIELPNQPLMDYFGKTAEELNAWGTNDAVHPDDLPRVTAEVTHSFTTGTPYDSELRYRRADGVYRWFQVRILPVRDTEGRITSWYGLLTDIEERKRAEEALREGEYESRLIVDSIPGLIAVLDTSGEVERVNQPLLDYLGKSLDELRQWAVDDTIHPDDRPAYLQAFGRSFAAGDAFEYEAARIRRFDGVYRWLTMRGLPLRDLQGHIVRWYFLLTEVDDRKRAEDELKWSEARHRVVVETASDAVVSIDESGIIILANPATKRIFGYDPEELIGKPLTVLMPGAMRKLHEEGFSRYLKTGARHLNWQGTEMTALRANGDEFPAEVSFGETTADQRKVFTGFIQDISEKRRIEEALSKVRSELAQMTRVTSLGALTASIAHEVNQPLSGIVTNASTCVRMLSSDPPDVNGALETARRTIRDGNRASDVITRLRALFSKKEVTIEPVDLNEASREVIALSLSDLQRDRVVLQMDLGEDLPLVMGDRVQLQQVILNLLRNASDAMSDVDDRARQLVIRTERDVDDSVRVTLQDTGTGIDPKNVDRLFDPFYTTKSSGMGMGLSVSRSIIEGHHGRLWAAVNDGPGATFAFSIPRATDGALGAGNLGAIQTSALTDTQDDTRNP
jgi:PAS domain S-box-containing protein